jgi:predicted hydrolase (HD superfamily)
MEAAMRTFAREYGEDRAHRVRSFEGTDFNQVS